MIELIIEDYCQNCSDFEAKVDKIVFGQCSDRVRHDTIIQCEHHERCKCIKEYLEKGRCYSYE